MVLTARIRLEHDAQVMDSDSDVGYGEEVVVCNKIPGRHLECCGGQIEYLLGIDIGLIVSKAALSRRRGSQMGWPSLRGANQSTPGFLQPCHRVDMDISTFLLLLRTWQQ